MKRTSTAELCFVCMYVAIFTFCSSLTPTAFSLLLAGKCVRRLSIWMLLLPIILAPDLQGAEEESGIPRLLVLFLSQLHSSGHPAGGALGLTSTAWPPKWNLLANLQPLSLTFSTYLPTLLLLGHVVPKKKKTFQYFQQNLFFCYGNYLRTPVTFQINYSINKRNFCPTIDPFTNRSLILGHLIVSEMPHDCESLYLLYLNI